MSRAKNLANFQTTITDGTTSVATTFVTNYITNGSAKAWISFNGSTVTSSADMTGVNDSFSVSSVVDNTTGDYSVNLSTSMASTNYISQVDTNSEELGNHSVIYATNNAGRTKTASQVQLSGKRYRHATDNRNLPIDISELMNTIHGDLA